mmetsp:Transcript_57521/g.120280  ORF Transcript_57521/g.120280 Transcript_57521/m.120280 type:complete len:287 (-) Transcript_57521:132-992(-)
MVKFRLFTCVAILATIQYAAPDFTRDAKGLNSSAACSKGVCTSEYGGWDPTYDGFLIENERCNIRKISSRGLTAEDFRKLSDDPFIVEGLSNWKCQLACTRHNLEKLYGEDNITMSSANTYSHQTRIIKLKTYLRDFMNSQKLDAPANETWYFFGDNNRSGWTAVFDSYRQPAYFTQHELLSGKEATLSFGIGASGSGVPFHLHGGGFSEVLWGMKRWFLMPAGRTPGFHPNQTALTWFRDGYPAFSRLSGAQECVIAPGEALFFPANWYHATLNIGETVFMSTFV